MLPVLGVVWTVAKYMILIPILTLFILAIKQGSRQGRYTFAAASNRRSFIVKPSWLGALVALVLLLLQPAGVLADEAVKLVDYMTRLQYFAHKAGLSIQAKNESLAHFYLHEIEEVIERLREVKVHDGYPIGALVKQILEPEFEKLEQSVEEKQFTQAQTDYDAMLNACNNCHKSTQHSYIKIEKRLDNPFMQSFAP